MRKALLAVLFLGFALSFTPACTPESVPPALPQPSALELGTLTNTLARDIDAMLSEGERNDVFSGSVIVIDGGKTVLEKGYGSADRKSGRKNTPDTLFRIGSISKQFTASAVLALVQDGKLSLQDPVAKFLPEFEKGSLEKDGESVTVHHLLSHTSGLADPRRTDAFKEAVWKEVIEPTKQIAFIKGKPLTSKPGAEFGYLNFNFLLAALIVERVSGKPYEAYLKSRLFEPLAMKDSGTHGQANLQNAVGYYDRNGHAATLQDDATFKDRDVSFAFGSGQILSTVKDLARWDRGLTTDTVLRKAQRDLLFTKNLKNYGYGFVLHNRGEVNYQWHNGAISPLGYTALIVRVPSKDRFIAYLANRDLDMVSPFEDKVIALAIK
jgi:CubicO group peptidase (beta-lactamase class C family)